MYAVEEPVEDTDRNELRLGVAVCAPLKHKELPTPLAVHGLTSPLVPRAAPRTAELLGEELLGTTEVAGQIKELGVVAELLEDVDRLERLGVRPSEQRLTFGRRDEEPVKC